MPLSLEDRWLAKHPNKTRSDVTAATMEGMTIVEFNGDPIMICADDAQSLIIRAPRPVRRSRDRALLIPEQGWIEIPAGATAKTVWKRHKKAPYVVCSFPVPERYDLLEIVGGRAKRV